MKNTMTGRKCMHGVTIAAVLCCVFITAAGATDFEQSPAGIVAVPDWGTSAVGVTRGGDNKPASTDCDVEINFDDVTAPAVFGSTVRLTEQYAGSGVHFEGPEGNDGGAILNEMGMVGVTGHSAPNFLAFNNNPATHLSDGGRPKGPETIRFDDSVVFFEASFGSGDGGTLTLAAYDAAGYIVDNASAALVGTVQRVRVMGQNITRVEFNCDAPGWVMDDICIINQGGAGILHLFAACVTSPDYGAPALANLGYTNVTQVTDNAQFEFAIRTGQWDLIILDAYGSPLSNALLDGLSKYYTDGGRVILNSYSLADHVGHGFFAAAGVSGGVSYEDPLPVYPWIPSPLFETPNMVPDLTNFINPCIREGARITVSTGTAAAGFTASDQAGEAALIVSPNERIILNAFTPGTVNQDADSDGKNDMIELYENEIFFLTGTGDGSLSVTPPALAFELPVDASDTQQVTLQNTSNVPIDWNSGTARVLFVCANVPGDFLGELRREPGIGQVDYLDARYETPDLAALQHYDVVLVASNYYFLDGDALGDVLADYVDAGGKIIHASSASYSDFAIGGRFESGGYAAFGVSSATDFAYRNLGTYDAAHPIMEGISTLQNYYGFPTALTYGSVLVASWDNGAPMVAVKGESIVGIDLFVVGLTPNYSGDVPRLFRNAVLWLQGESPLSISPGSGTLAPGATANVDITADGTGLPLGAFEKLLAGFKGIQGGVAAADVSLLVASACMEDSAFSQRPYMPAESGWAASTSNEGSLWKCYENFSGLTAPVSALRWWGVDNEYAGGWNECDRVEPDSFRASFYADEAGQPGALVKEMLVEPTVVDTGLLGQGVYNFKEYEAVLQEKVRLDQGWISIEGAGASTCWFLWTTSAESADGYLQVHDSDPPVALLGGLSLCIVTDPECTPIADLSMDSTTSGSTVSQPAFNDIYACGGGDAPGPEAVYRFVPAADGDVEISLTDIAIDLNLYLLEGQCLPAQCTAFGDETLSFSAAAGTEYFIVVDGADPTGGDFVLHLEPPAVEGEGEVLPEDEGEIAGEGEVEGETEGESPSEGEYEGESLFEGEHLFEGEIPSEGEGEGEQPPDGCCAQGCQGCGPETNKMEEFRRFLGDYLLVGLSMIGLFLLSGARR